MSKVSEIITSSKIAFDFVKKLYRENAVMIHEMERILGDEPEEFIIGKPSGYGITSRKSSGLETRFTGKWLTSRFSIFFVPNNQAVSKGATTTFFDDQLKIIYFRFLLDGYETYSFNKKLVSRPSLIYGVFNHMSSKSEKHRKVESLLGHIDYHEEAIFSKLPSIEYSDSYYNITGKCEITNLFALNSVDKLKKEVMDPVLSMYRKK